jgi:uncharacterized OB-fold protein
MSPLNQRKMTAPEPSPETRPFWDAAAQGRFVLPVCGDCGKTHWYPRALCPFCFGDSITWKQASGRATVYSFTIMRREPVPYVLAYATLEEGPVMMTNLLAESFDALAVGQPVSLVFLPTEGGPPVPAFEVDHR